MSKIKNGINYIWETITGEAATTINWSATLTSNIG